MPRVRTPFNYDTWAASQMSGTITTGDGLARQEFKEEADINTIVKNFGLGYEVPQGLRLPTYGDFTDNADYHEACNAIAMANESFDLLPADMRARFNNDPGLFVDFCSNDANTPELEKMGLLKPVIPDPIVPVTPVPTGVQLPQADSNTPA